MSALALVAIGGLGLVAGSIATSGVHRLADPTLTMWRPGPRCPDCHERLRRRELVPVLSWLVQRGRCRSCGQRFGWPYPAVEITTAALFVVTAWRRPDPVETWVLLGLVWVLVVASVTDLYVYLIPNRLLFPALAASVGAMVPLALIDEPARLGHAALGAALYFVLLFVPHLVHPAGMGMGDVKLAAVLGLHLGFVAGGSLTTVRMIVFAMLIGSILGVVAGGALYGCRRLGFDPLPDPLDQLDDPSRPSDTSLERGSASGFPFGPPLAVGCLLVIWFPASFGLS